MTDDRAAFESQRRSTAAEMAADGPLQARALDLFTDSDRHGYSYQWSWLGLPIIQIPQDIVATQEIIWAARPTVVVETGVARGGSAVLHASILQLLGRGKVIAVDVEIREHNRAAIEGHPLASRIELVVGSSVDPVTVDHVRSRIAPDDQVMVVLDSNHTHDHVLQELRAYAQLVSLGQYLVVADTIVEHIPVQTHRPRPWGPGNNPASALDEFLGESDAFERDPYLNAKLLLTSTPGGYLRRVR